MAALSFVSKRLQAEQKIFQVCLHVVQELSPNQSQVYAIYRYPGQNALSLRVSHVSPS